MDVGKIGVFLVAALLSLAMTTLAASATTVTIQSATVDVSGNTTVPIMINDVTGVKGANIILDYHNSVVHALDIGNSDFSIETYKVIDNVTGYVQYTVFNMVALNGDVKFADVTLEGKSSGESALNLTVVSLTDGTTEIPRDVTNGTFTVQADDEPPIVANPSADPLVIPDDTDCEPLWGELTELRVNVTDESEIASVTVNLSAIGGGSKEPLGDGFGLAVMFNVGNYTESTLWTVYNYTTNASEGTAGWNGTAYVPYCLPVNATDIYGHSNTSVCISLTVMNNGDVDESGAANLNDAIHLANYALGVPGHDLVPEVADVDGISAANLNDAIYLANYALGVPAYAILH